jgi:hypothetical protein
MAFEGCAIAQAISCQLLTMEAWIFSQSSTYGICGGQSGTMTELPPSS